jgi:hypothetical protein
MENNKTKTFDLLLSNSKEKISVEIATFIIEVVQAYYNLDENYVKTRIRKREYVLARQVSMYLIRNNTNLSLKAIGDIYSRDHATALHSIKQIKNYLCWDKEIKRDIKELEKIIKFKATAIGENADWKKKYYYLDLSSFHSILLNNHPDKSIIMAGFTQREVELFTEILAEVKSIRNHQATGMYVLERLEIKNNKENGRKEDEESKG